MDVIIVIANYIFVLQVNFRRLIRKDSDFIHDHEPVNDRKFTRSITVSKC